MQVIWVFIAIFCTALFGIFLPRILPFIGLGALAGIGYILWQIKEKGFNPQSKTYKELEKVKKKRLKTDEKKHKHINDQVAYISKVWGYTKEQEKIIKKFIEYRAYSEMYNKLTASLLPQIIRLMDNCNARERKGCKREVSRRLKGLTLLMKRELQNKKSQNIEDYETSLAVYDHLLNRNILIKGNV